MKKRQEKQGLVVSDKMEKTVVVRVDEYRPHPLYEKRLKRSKKFMAHNMLGAKEGDLVRIISSKPISARKHWIVKEVIKSASA